MYAGCRHFAWYLDYFLLKFKAWLLKTSICIVWRAQTAQRKNNTYISRQLKRLFPYHDSKMASCIVRSLSFRQFKTSFSPLQSIHILHWFPGPMSQHTWFLTKRKKKSLLYVWEYYFLSCHTLSVYDRKNLI